MDAEYEFARLDLGPERYERYEELRARGNTHNMAMILASQRAPGTDRTDERWRLMRDPESHARGLKGTGKYQPGLARFPGDPQAVVHSRKDAKRVAEKNGWKIQNEPMNHGRGAQRSGAPKVEVS